MTTFWLSFADQALPVGSQFLGVVIVEASDVAGAIDRAWALGINPGGEVLSRELLNPVVTIPGKWRDRLLSEADIEEMEGELAPEAAA